MRLSLAARSGPGDVVVGVRVLQLKLGFSWVEVEMVDNKGHEGEWRLFFNINIKIKRLLANMIRIEK